MYCIWICDDFNFRNLQRGSSQLVEALVQACNLIVPIRRLHPSSALQPKREKVQEADHNQVVTGGLQIVKN